MFTEGFMVPYTLSTVSQLKIHSVITTPGIKILDLTLCLCNWAFTYMYVCVHLATLFTKCLDWKKRPLDPILSHSGIFHTQHVQLVYNGNAIIFTSIFLSVKCPSWGSPTNILYIFLASSITDTYPAHIIILNCNSLIIACLVMSMTKLWSRLLETTLLSTWQN